MQKTFKDQLGNYTTVPFPPKRIVSLVPSQTELLADLQLDQEVLGITKFCVHPPAWRKSKTLVGGTKNFSAATLRALRPDLVIANKEENEREQIQALQREFPVWISDIATLDDALAMIRAVGALTDRAAKADAIAASIERAFEGLSPTPPARSVLYLIWRKPWMAAARHTFIHHMLESAGFENCLRQLARYPVLTPGQVSGCRPDLVFLSSEPYPFREKHVAELQALCPGARVVLVDGEMFSWYGSRLIQAPGYFRSLFATPGR